MALRPGDRVIAAAMVGINRAYLCTDCIRDPATSASSHSWGDQVVSQSKQTRLIQHQATMADDEVATRAPESDLAEQSAIPGDSAVDQGPSLGVSLDGTNAMRDANPPN